MKGESSERVPVLSLPAELELRAPGRGCKQALERLPLLVAVEEDVSEGRMGRRAAVVRFRTGEGTRPRPCDFEPPARQAVFCLCFEVSDEAVGRGRSTAAGAGTRLNGTPAAPLTAGDDTARAA